LSESEYCTIIVQYSGIRKKGYNLQLFPEKLGAAKVQQAKSGLMA